MAWQSGGGYPGVSGLGGNGLLINGPIAVVNGPSGNDAFDVTQDVANNRSQVAITGELVVSADNGSTAFHVLEAATGVLAITAVSGPFVTGQGASFWSHATPNAQPTVSGTVTAGTLAQLQTVVKSFLTAIGATGLVVDGTT